MTCLTKNLLENDPREGFFPFFPGIKQAGRLWQTKAKISNPVVSEVYNQADWLLAKQHVAILVIAQVVGHLDIKGL